MVHEILLDEPPRSHAEYVANWEDKHGGLAKAEIVGNYYLFPDGAARSHTSRHLAQLYEPDDNPYVRAKSKLEYWEARLARFLTQHEDLGARLMIQTEQAFEQASGYTPTADELAELEKLGKLVKWTRRCTNQARHNLNKATPRSVKLKDIVNRECQADAIKAQDKLAELGFSRKAPASY